MVQLPEPCGEQSEAYKAGYKTICEIGKERIRRAGAKIKEENPYDSMGSSSRTREEVHNNILFVKTNLTEIIN